MDIDLKQLVLISNSLAEEKNVPLAIVHGIIEKAVATAWRSDYGYRDQDVRATINVHKGDINIYVAYEVVEAPENEHSEISLEDAQKRQPQIRLGDKIEEHHEVSKLSRIAAQAAKQTILRELRRAESEVILSEFEDKIGKITTGVITRADSRLVHLEIGRARGLMPPSEQIQNEHYHIGQRLKVLLKVIERDGNEPKLIVSRGDIRFLELLFEAEVPEISNGSVVIKKIAREPGVRSKVAVASNVPNVDPVGTLVGGHGARVKSVNNEIGETEKIDIIVWDEDPKQYIINSLNPTEIKSIEIKAADDDRPPQAMVVVSEDQLNIAIGRSGQNVRLAGSLTGYEIDIISETPNTKRSGHGNNPPVAVANEKPRLARKEQLEESLLETIEAAHQDDSDQEINQEADEPEEAAETSESN